MAGGLKPRQTLTYSDGSTTYTFSGNDNSGNDNNGNGQNDNGVAIAYSQPGITAGAIAGIVVGLLIFLALVGAVALVLYRRNVRRKAYLAYGTKATLPLGATLDDGPPPPYQPPAYPPGAALASPGPSPSISQHQWHSPPQTPSYQAVSPSLASTHERAMDERRGEEFGSPALRPHSSESKRYELSARLSATMKKGPV